MHLSAASNPTICHACSRLLRKIREGIEKGEILGEWKTAAEIVRTYKSCELCTLVATSEGRSWKRARDPGYIIVESEREASLLAWHEEVVLKNTSGFGKPARISQVRRNLYGRLSEMKFGFDDDETTVMSIVIAVWIEPLATGDRAIGSLADIERIRQTSSLTWTKPVLSNDSPETFSTFESWLNRCLAGHCPVEKELNSCAVTLAGEVIDQDGLRDTPLPRRILAIGQPGDPLVRLLEPNGIKAPYVALSYRWGTGDKEPLKTTSESIRRHMEGISMAYLPKTFRDAVQITRGLGIGYLWIDSLCIVQDDQADWLRESRAMGELYEHAALTIAASCAKDPTQGCFVAERPGKILKVPLSWHSNHAQHIDPPLVQVCFAQTPIQRQTASHPLNSELSTRAWVFQEWFLSRRIIFCTRAGFIWKCRCLQHDEHEIRNKFHDMKERLEWPVLLAQYSSSKLTYETDRLVALQGIANQVRQTKTGEYHFGVFTDDMPQILFWMTVPRHKGQPAGTSNQAPSWSWASSLGHRKLNFLTTTNQFFCPARNIFENEIVVVENGELQMRAPMAKIRADQLNPMAIGFPLGDSRWSVETMFLRKRIAYTYCNRAVHSIRRSAQPDSSPDDVVGFAVFDNPGCMPSREAYAVVLMETPRFALDPLWTGDLGWHGHKLEEKLVFHRMIGSGTWRMDSGKQYVTSYRDDLFVCDTKEFLSERPKGSLNVLTQVEENRWFAVGRYDAQKEAEDAVEDKRSLEKLWRTRCRGGTQDGSEDGVEEEECPDRNDGSPSTETESIGADRKIEYDCKGPSVLWALLLEPMDDSQKSFKRIGVGLIGHPDWLERAKVGDIRIV